jgi:hypothetical protein
MVYDDRVIRVSIGGGVPTMIPVATETAILNDDLTILFVQNLQGHHREAA